MEIQHLMEFIKNPKNIYQRPNPVLALRENLGAPRHELNQQKRQAKRDRFARGYGMGDLRLRGLTPKRIDNDFVMLNELFGAAHKWRYADSPVSHEHPYLQLAESRGLVIPFKRFIHDDKGTMADKVQYDKLPLFGKFLGIDVRDLAQMAFIVQQERSMSNDLKEIGWRSLGSGMYSHALVHRSNQDIVAKVCWSGDNCVLWLKYAMANQGKAGIPVIHSIIKCGRGYIAFMERMRNAEEGSDCISEMPQFNFVDRVFSGFDYESCMQDLQRRVHLGHSVEKYYRELYNVVHTFMKWLPENSQRYDFHSGNALYSPTQGFVVTDPIT